jgi:hypothetical protein
VLQDVCLSIWTEDHSHDLMWKVTDVCDPKDCPTPLDIKVEPYKVRRSSSMMTAPVVRCGHGATVADICLVVQDSLTALTALHSSRAAAMHWCSSDSSFTC